MNDLKDIPEVPISIPPPRFANPWQGLKGDPTASTVNCVMPKEAFNRVKQCRLEGGTIQTTMNHLWIKLIDLLERKGITGYESVREFEDAVKRSVLVLPEDVERRTTDPISGSSAPAVDPATHGNDVAGAVERIRDTAPSQSVESNVPSNVSEGSPKGTKRSGKQRKGQQKP